MNILASTVSHAFLQTLIIMFELFGIIIIFGLLLGYSPVLEYLYMSLVIMFLQKSSRTI